MSAAEETAAHFNAVTDDSRAETWLHETLPQESHFSLQLVIALEQRDAVSL
jgi:hypothetical protein